MNFLILILIPFTIFFVGFMGIFFNKKNIILLIICIELQLLAINFSFLLISFYLDDITGQIFALFVLVVAAAETSIGLAILVVYYRLRGTISIDFVNVLAG